MRVRRLCLLSLFRLPLQREALELSNHRLEHRPLQRLTRAGRVSRLQSALLVEDQHVAEVPCAFDRACGVS